MTSANANHNPLDLDICDDMAIRFALLPLLFATTLLAGCWSLDRPAAESTAMNAAPGVAPPTNLAGKWMLDSPGGGSCIMNFGAPPDVIEGTIAPAGGCPFNFFTSRKWAYVTGGLVIRDHKAVTLAQLSPVGPDRYEGRTSDGQEVTLSRQ
jgi:hypothetical protein